MAFNLSEESDFIQACATGNGKEVQKLLATNSELIEKVASNGSTPLMFAAEGGSSEVIELLLKNKADINALNPKDMSALWFAVENKQWPVVVKLVEAGAKNLDASPAEGVNRGVTALWWAAHHKQWPLVVKLIEVGAGNLDTTPAEGASRGLTILWMAAGSHQWTLVDKLIGAGANLDATPTVGPDRGITALWLTADSAQWSLTVKLLTKGARDLDATPAEGEYRGVTALWLAAANRQWPLVIRLLKAGARNLDTTPIEGEYRGIAVLWWATCYQQWDLIETLLKAGTKNLDASPAEGEHSGVTALWWVTCHLQWDLAETLLKAGAGNLDASPAEGEHSGVTALWWATRNFKKGQDHGKCQKLLLKKGASLLPSPIIHPAAMTPRANLLCTAANGLHELAAQEKIDDEKAIQGKLNSFLDDLGDSLNGRINGMTALHSAVLNKKRLIVEALILKGADLLLKNREGKTAAALAVESGFDVPLLAIHTFLHELKTAIDEPHSNHPFGRDTKELGESKVERESKGIADTLEGNRNKVDTLFNRKDSLLVCIERIELPHRNTLWFEYGSLLEKMLPTINEKEVKAAFEKVTCEAGELYQRAQAQLFHYATLAKGKCSASSSLSSLSLEDEVAPEDNQGLMIQHAINAGTHVPPSVLNTILSQYIQENNSYKANSNLTSGEVVFRLLETRKNKMKEIEDENKKLKERMSQLMSGAHSLVVGSADSETTVASSSSSSTLIPISPLLFSTGAAVKAEGPSTGQPPIVSKRRKAGDELSSSPDVSKRGRGGDQSNILIVNNSLTSEVELAHSDEAALHKKA
jgi:ankyrin repeat protein